METNNIALVNGTVNLANGTYRGTWSGYMIRIDNTEATLETVTGVRSLTGVQVIITVIDGYATAEQE